jgi:hypothetical protein
LLACGAVCGGGARAHGGERNTGGSTRREGRR